ncbi:hypothetical protein A4R44_00230 [Amycolatopsis sp. M39]|nr:hypothetical protein A4R44_00230 [Amycolatopsis sp. M39]
MSGKLSGRILATAMLFIAVFPFLSGIAAADDAPSPIVEGFDYPGADQIYAQYHLRLLKGDGHILFADCASGGTLVKVWSRAAANDFFRFRITGESGYLTMDVPDVYAVTGDQHRLKATVVVKDVATRVHPARRIAVREIPASSC